MERQYPIGVLARKTGTKVVTIRYYERIGLLPVPQRTESNYRLYDDMAAGRLHFIRQCRALGFSLEEIRELCVLSGQARTARLTIAAMAGARLRQVQAEQRKLAGQAARLRALMRACPGSTLSGCGIIDGLQGGDLMETDCS